MPPIFSKFGTGKVSILPEVALASSHPFKTFIEKSGQLAPGKVINKDVQVGGIYKRLHDRYARHNYNNEPHQTPGIQLEYFKNLNSGGWNGQEISHTKHLFDYNELDELIDLDARTNGFQKVLNK